MVILICPRDHFLATTSTYKKLSALVHPGFALMALSTALLALLIPYLMPNIVNSPLDYLLWSHQGWVLVLFHQILERDSFLRNQILLWNSDFHSIREVFCVNLWINLLICSVAYVVLHQRDLNSRILHFQESSCWRWRRRTQKILPLWSPLRSQLDKSLGLPPYVTHVWLFQSRCHWRTLLGVLMWMFRWIKRYSKNWYLLRFLSFLLVVYLFCFSDFQKNLRCWPRFTKFGVDPRLLDNSLLWSDILLYNLFVLIFQLHHPWYPNVIGELELEVSGFSSNADKLAELFEAIDDLLILGVGIVSLQFLPILLSLRLAGLIFWLQQLVRSRLLFDLLLVVGAAALRNVVSSRIEFWCHHRVRIVSHGANRPMGWRCL